MKYFILGIIFMLVAQPVLTAFGDFICTIFEMLSTKIQVTTAKDTLAIKKMAAEAEKLDEEVHTNAIGFVCSEECCCEEEEEDE